MGSKTKTKSRKQQQQQPEESSSYLDEEEEIDYAATADQLFRHSDDDDDDKPHKQHIGHDDSNDSGEDDDDESNIEENEEHDENFDDDSESVEEEEEEEEEEDEGTDNEDIQSAEENQGENETNNTTLPNNNKIVDTGEEPCTFDLRNLLAVSAHPIHAASLYGRSSATVPMESSASPATPPKVTIPSEIHANDDFLLQRAQAGCQKLVAALWQLPVERSAVGPLVQLPAFDDSKIPRALPPPPPRQETKWEKFAKEKGIGQNKDKRSRKVWDESTGEWMYRHGFQKANNKSDGGKEWPIMEVKDSDDPYADPWEREREAKRIRTDKNMEARMRNEERAGGLAKGTTNRILKSKAVARTKGQMGGGNDQVLPIGVPVDIKSSGKNGRAEIPIETKPSQRGKTSTMAALLATQSSTASLGKFDKMREGEPERKKMHHVKKRKYESATDQKVVATEAERSLKILKSLGSGAVEKEKARKKGLLASGETAYDYEFNDGLGASSFRKKKGRAGTGKMKKITRKRVK